MQIEEKYFNEVCLLKPHVFEDNRGSFFESYSKRVFSELGLETEFNLEGHSYNKQKGTIRGLHFQVPPHAQTLSIRVVHGAVMDVLVSVRKDSPYFGQYVVTTLSGENRRQLIVPPGFAHGFCTLTDDVHMLYKMSEYYVPQHDRTIRWNDPEINIPWGVDDPIMSDKDRNAPLLKKIDVFF